MKILLYSLLIAVAAGLGLTLGVAWRRTAGPTAASAESVPATSAPPTGAQAKSFRGSNQLNFVPLKDDSPLATKLERDLSMSAGVTRWLYWMEALEKATPADFPRLARLARGNPTVMRFVAGRWVEVDPRHMFDTLVAASKDRSGLPYDELVTLLFEEWPKRDPDSTIAALSTTNGSAAFANWRSRVATAIVEKDVERGLRLMSEWRIEHYVPRMPAVTKWAAADPRHAAEFTLQHPAGVASRVTMEAIGKQWAKTEPGRALEFAATQSGELGTALAVSALKQWAGQDLNEAAAWLTKTDARTRNRLGPTFVEAWAKQDTQGALTWCQENLAGSSLALAVGGVLKGAAATDVVGAAGLVTAMDPSPARAEAAAAVAQKWFPDYNSDKPVKRATLAWLAGLDSDSVMRVLKETEWRWSESDPKSLAAFLASTSSERVPSHTYSTLARQMARRNPTEALEWASGLPADRALEAGCQAFNEWQRSQPESAMKWLNALPSADTRRQPIFENAIRALAYDPQASEQLAQLPVPDRAAARNVIATMPLPEGRRASLLELLKAP